MRYSRDHKAATRDRILQHAAKLFRERGYEGVRIDAIMDAAGLTRGGFYAHFASKAALFEEALSLPPVLARWLANKRGDRERARPADTRGVIRGYLSMGNRAGAASKCTLSSLASAMPHADTGARRSYESGLNALVEELRHHTQEQRGKRADSAARASAVVMIGAMTMARAVEDDELAESILDAAREQVRRILCV